MGMMKQVKHWMVMAACVAATSAAMAAQPGAKPLAQMANGEVIGEQDLADYLDRRMDLRGAARSAWGVEQVVSEMALTRVLNLEGESLGVARSSGEAPTRFDDAYALAVQSKQEPACERPADEREARQYFDKHPKALVVPAQARVQRMMLPADSEIEGRPAMDWLKAQAQAIAGGARFADAAEHAQAAYTVETQGDLGWIALEGDNEIVAALRAAHVGGVLGPLREGNFGYVFQVVNKRAERQLTWDEVRSSAAVAAQVHCRKMGQDRLRDELFKKYGVKVDKAAIRAFFERTIPVNQ